MKFKRQEPFRFVFDQPILGDLRVAQDEINQGIPVEIMDLSPNGMRIIVANEFSVNKDQPMIISFTLNEVQLELAGTIAWEKTQTNKHLYGFIGDGSIQSKTLIVDELKKYAKRVTK